MPYPVYQSILFTLLHSIWQMGLLYFIYKIYFCGALQDNPAAKKKILFFISGLQIILSLVTFCGLFYNYFQVGTIFSFGNTVIPGMGTVSIYRNLFYMYCLLVVARIVYIIMRYQQQKNLIGRSLIPISEYFNSVLNKLSFQLSLHKKISCWYSDHITTPIVYGFVKPMIIFPVAALNSLTAQETEALLLHELAHIKNNDHLLNLILIIQETLFFFNPFMWLIGAEIRDEREKACDMKVVSGGFEKLVYATALYKVAQPFRDINLNLAATGPKNQLLDRIKFFMQEPVDQRNKILFPKILVSSLCLVLIVLFSMVSFTEIKKSVTIDNKATLKKLLPVRENAFVKTESLPGTFINKMILPEPKKASPENTTPVKTGAKLFTKNEVANVPDLSTANVAYASNQEKNQKIIYIEEENSGGHKTLTMISVQQDGTTIELTPIIKVETAVVARDSIKTKIDSSTHKIFIYH